MTDSSFSDRFDCTAEWFISHDYARIATALEDAKKWCLLAKDGGPKSASDYASAVECMRFICRVMEKHITEADK